MSKKHPVDNVRKENNTVAVLFLVAYVIIVVSITL